jgi:esterase/lipase superfamily enzyme
MRREHVDLPLRDSSHTLSLIAYGDYGRPVLVFPTEAGRAWDFENNGMVDAVRDLIDAGRVKLYCMDYVANADGDHLSWLRERVSILLVCGQGAWEVNPTGALPSSREMAALLQRKGIRCELDLWGFDVAHDWPWWRQQLAHHLPRFC